MSRNLLEYPITLGEVEEALQMAMDRERIVGAYGDQTLNVLSTIRRLLRERFTEADFCIRE